MLFLVYLMTHSPSTRMIRQGAALVLVSALALAVVPPLMPEAFSRFSDRIQQAFTLDQRADSGRVDHLPACWTIIKDAPLWGHGLASIASTEINDIDSTTVAYAMLLMERGVIGTVFLIAPWIYIGIQSWLLPRHDTSRTCILLLTALQLYTFWTSSIVPFLPFWLSLGVTSSLLLRPDVPAATGVYSGLTCILCAATSLRPACSRSAVLERRYSRFSFNERIDENRNGTRPTHPGLHPYESRRFESRRSHVSPACEAVSQDLERPPERLPHRDIVA